MYRTAAKLLAVAAVLASFIGCEVSVPREELGGIVYYVPNVPGAEDPYVLPDLDPVAGDAVAPEEADDAPEAAESTGESAEPAVE